jgi:hypothetical protein
VPVRLDAPLGAPLGDRTVLIVADQPVPYRS